MIGALCNLASIFVATVAVLVMRRALIDYGNKMVAALLGEHRP